LTGTAMRIKRPTRMMRVLHSGLNGRSHANDDSAAIISTGKNVTCGN